MNLAQEDTVTGIWFVIKKESSFKITLNPVKSVRKTSMYLHHLKLFVHQQVLPEFYQKLLGDRRPNATSECKLSTSSTGDIFDCALQFFVDTEMQFSCSASDCARTASEHEDLVNYTCAKVACKCLQSRDLCSTEKLIGESKQRLKIKMFILMYI